MLNTLKKPKNSALVIAGIVVLLIFTWLLRLRMTPEVAEDTPTTGPAVEAVYATGVAEPVVQAKIAPLSAARVLNILKRDGDTVQQGDVLAQLDAREAQGNLGQLAAKRDYLADELSRQRALVSKGFVSASSLSKLDFDLKQAEASIAAARRPLSETLLRSPIQGIVLRQDGEAGEMIAAGQTLFWVGASRPLRITADVDEEDILRIQVGQKALLKTDALKGQALPATVTDITEKGDSLNKNYRVRLSLPDDTPLKTGMTVEVNILIQERQNALLVPNSALRGDQLWVLESGNAVLKPVKVGIRGQDKSEILEGLTLQTPILPSVPTSLKSGQAVRVR